MLNCELHVNLLKHRKSIITESNFIYFFLKEFQLRSFKGSPSEMEGMNFLMRLVCLLPGL